MKNHHCGKEIDDISSYLQLRLIERFYVNFANEVTQDKKEDIKAIEAPQDFSR